MKDTKDIRRESWVMPQGWDFEALGVPGSHFFQTWACGISNRWG